LITGYEADYYRDINLIRKALVDIEKRLGEIRITLEDKK